MKTRHVRELPNNIAACARTCHTFILISLIISCMISMLVFSGCNMDPKKSIEEIAASTVTFVPDGESYYQVENLEVYKVADNENLSISGIVSCGDQVAVRYWVNTKEQLKDGTFEVTGKRYLTFFDDDGNVLSTTELDSFIGQEYVIDMTSDSSGNACLLVTENGLLKFFTISASGSLMQDPITLVSETSYTASSFELDNVGNVYTCGYDGESSMNQVVVFEATGDQKCVIEDYNLRGNLIRSGNKVYADYTNIYSQEEEFSSFLFEIDAEEGCLKNPIEDKVGFETNGSDGMYANSPYGVTYLNPETLCSSDLFLWSDMNADKQLYGYGTLAVISQDIVFCLSYQNPGETEDDTVIILRKNADTSISEKTTITVAGVWEEGYEPFQLTDAVLTFNSQNEEYRIETIAYVDMQSLHLAMLGGVVPDIVVAQQSESLSIFESSGLLQDLYPFMETDTDFHKEDYFDNIFSLSESNGKLFKFPTSFIIQGLVGLTSQIGDITGWTVQDADAALLLQGESQCFGQGLPMSYLLDQCVRNSLTTFIDYETNTCSFDSEEFCELLQWSKENGRPDDQSDQGYDIENPLLTEAGIVSPVGYARFASDFQEPISIVGYPSPTKNSAMCFLFLQLGITTGTKNPDVCWDFLKMFVSEDAQRKVVEDWFLFSVRKSIFEEQLEVAMHPEEFNSDPDVENELIPLDEESAQDLRDLIDGLNTMYPFDESVMQIIMEEAPAYFYDQKSAEDVAALIQNRVQTLVYERATG